MAQLDIDLNSSSDKILKNQSGPVAQLVRAVDS